MINFIGKNLLNNRLSKVNIFTSQQVKSKLEDYDSYSSDDENMKKTKKKLNNSANKVTNKNGINKNRSSAPFITSSLSSYQKQKNKMISDKLYMPYITDKLYKIDVNKKLTSVKEDAKNNAMLTNKLNKQKDEVEKIGKQIFIYNNPSNLKYIF